MNDKELILRTFQRVINEFTTKMMTIMERIDELEGEERDDYRDRICNLYSIGYQLREFFLEKGNEDIVESWHKFCEVYIEDLTQAQCDDDEREELHHNIDHAIEARDQAKLHLLWLKKKPKVEGH